MNFIFTLPRTIIFGQGSIERLSSEAGNFGIGTVLLVTSRGMTQRGTAQRVTDMLSARVKIYDRVDPEPGIEHVEECKTGCNLVIGLGGGSVMDVAKKAAMDLGVPKIMIPTTAGPGSEVTHESVIKVEGRKQAFVDEKLTPDVAIVDPELTRSLPPRLAASSGIDALAHAVECYGSKRANPIVRTLAYQAYQIIKDNLKKAIAGNDEARVNMSLASLMAGMAMGNSGTALCHALTYPLSNEGIPHGEAVAMTLPYALEFNDFDREITAEVKGIVQDLALGRKPEGDIQQMAKLVMRDDRHLSNNPRPVSLEDIITIYRRAIKEWDK